MRWLEITLGIMQMACSAGVIIVQLFLLKSVTRDKSNKSSKNGS
jgi:hypothetical protein